MILAMSFDILIGRPTVCKHIPVKIKSDGIGDFHNLLSSLLEPIPKSPNPPRPSPTKSHPIADYTRHYFLQAMHERGVPKRN